MSFALLPKMTPEVAHSIALQESRLYASIRNEEEHVVYNIDEDDNNINMNSRERFPVVRKNHTM